MIGAIGAGLVTSALRDVFSTPKAQKAKETDVVEEALLPSFIQENLEADVATVETAETVERSSLDKALFSDTRSFVLLAEQQAGVREPLIPPADHNKG